MSQPETRLQQRIVEALRGRGWYAVRQRLVGRRGWPDLYVIPPCGCALHFEVKRRGRKLEPLQRQTLAELESAGAVVDVMSRVDEAIRCIERHLETCPKGVLK